MAECALDDSAPDNDIVGIIAYILRLHTTKKTEFVKTTVRKWRNW